VALLTPAVYAAKKMISQNIVFQLPIWQILMQCPQPFLFRTFPYLVAVALAEAKGGKSSEAVKL
jgi:hypothetical protein